MDGWVEICHYMVFKADWSTRGAFSISISNIAKDSSNVSFGNSYKYSLTRNVDRVLYSEHLYAE
jgi:hypothetical protein